MLKNDLDDNNDGPGTDDPDYDFPGTTTQPPSKVTNLPVQHSSVGYTGQTYTQLQARATDCIVLADGSGLDKLSDVPVKEINKAFGKHGRKLCSMLNFRRPSGGENQTGLIGAICNVIRDAKFEPKQDDYGNVYALLLPKDVTQITTCFTAHTDTVHIKDETQEIAFNVAERLLFKVDQSPLGADDATGVYIMLQMIKAMIPGLYCFFKDEERGCVGSGHFLKSHLQFMKDTGIKKVISFDRKGTGDVITKQRGNVCASDKFAGEVAAALNAQGMKYSPSPNGVFTDSATFMYHIPECTNISVGYDMQHGPRETQCLTHLDALIDAVVKINWEAIGAYRLPAPKPKPYVAPQYQQHQQSKLGSTSGSTDRQAWADLDDLDRMMRPDDETYAIFQLISNKPWLVSLWLSQEFSAKGIKESLLELFVK